MAGSLSSDPGVGFLQAMHARALLQAVHIAKNPTMYHRVRRAFSSVFFFVLGWWTLLGFIILEGATGHGAGTMFLTWGSIFLLVWGIVTGYLLHVLRKVTP